MTLASWEAKMWTVIIQARFQFTAHVALSLHYWYSLITPRPVEAFITAKVRYSLILITIVVHGIHTHTRTSGETRSWSWRWRWHKAARWWISSCESECVIVGFSCELHGGVISAMHHTDIHAVLASGFVFIIHTAHAYDTPSPSFLLNYGLQTSGLWVDLLPDASSIT